MSQATTVQLDNFFGLRENQSGDLTLKDGELAKCTNCRITDNFKIQKRDGYTEKIAGIGNPIRGMWHGKIAGVSKFVFARDGKIYEGDLSGGTATQIGIITDARTFFFGFSDKLYVQNGIEYKVWDGTGSFTDVSDNAYIPLIQINTPPAGGGTAFEEINMLTGKRRVQFDGDGTSATYQLPETNLLSVDTIYVDGVLSTAWGYTASTGVITPTTPANFTSGTNNIDVYYSKY